MTYLTLEERVEAFKLWMAEGERRYGITVTAIAKIEKLGEALLIKQPETTLVEIAGWQPQTIADTPPKDAA